MASVLTLLKAFFNGQGAGAQTYPQYSPDLDSNFIAIEANFNQLNSEVRAFAGQNAAISTDLIISGASPAVLGGFIGADSFPFTFLTTGVPDDTFQVGVGVAFAGPGRIVNGVVGNFVGSGASGLRFFAMTDNGIVSQETSAFQQTIDLYSVNWNGTEFDTGTVVRLPGAATFDIMPAANDFQNQRIQTEVGQTTESGIGAFTYEAVFERFEDLNRIITGMTSSGLRTSASADQADLKPIALGGSASTPGLILGNGTLYNTNSGLFGTPNATDANASFGVAIDGATLLSFAENAGEGQVSLRTGTVLATPPVAFAADGDTGIRYIAADHYALVVGALDALQVKTTTGDAQVSFVGDPAGDGTVPGLTPIGDLDTGWMSDAADTLKLMLGGTVGAFWNLQRQRTSATQGRASASRATFNIASNTITAVDLTTEEFDQGSYHDTGVNPDRMTVPTGHAGVFQITAHVEFDESTSATPNVGDRGVQITVNGTKVASWRGQAAGAGDSAGSVSIEHELVATDIVRVTAFQDSGNAMDVSGLLTVRLGD